MEFIEPDVFQINDVTYRAWQCGHCGETATERDVLEAVARYKREKGDEKCLACGLVIVHAGWTVTHSVAGTVKLWCALPTTPPPGIVLRHSEGRGIGTGGWLHL